MLLSLSRSSSGLRGSPGYVPWGRHDAAARAPLRRPDPAAAPPEGGVLEAAAAVLAEEGPEEEEEAAASLAAPRPRDEEEVKRVLQPHIITTIINISRWKHEKSSTTSPVERNILSKWFKPNKMGNSFLRYLGTRGAIPATRKTRGILLGHSSSNICGAK